ncbi:acetate--CoA ligase family protein [Streptomyces sp. NPDC126514]|uniref:acetate--CoA ligase family protein n=1 Tax=Streptomyces sp. NPDC126514 TaxID=3155210 RepID=UPI0033200DB3
MSRDLSTLFDPKSVAVVGASDDPAKYGHALAEQALRGPRHRPVHLINRRGGKVLGRRAARSLAEIGEPVELVVVAVSGPGAEETIDAALACRARAIVAVCAGFAETGPAGLARQQAVAARVRQAGAMLVGPNCLGVADNTTELNLTPHAITPGGIALLSQSGNLALELQLRLSPHGLGFSRFVSLGNQSDITLVDLVEDCARHAPTSAIAVYAEDFADGRAFARAAALAGKPVVLLTGGRSPASARSAQSHTGALATSADVVAAACRDAGVELVATPREMAVILRALHAPYRCGGRRAAVFTDGGGHGVIAADMAEAAGLDVPELATATQIKLRSVLWEQAAVGNPVDLAGRREQEPGSYATAVGALLASDEVDAVLMTGHFGSYTAAHGGAPRLAAGERRAAGDIVTHWRRRAKPLVVQSMYPASPSCQILADAGIPVFSSAEDASRALAATTAGRPGGGRSVTVLPPAAPRLRDFGYHAVRRLLATAEVLFPPAREITCELELLEAAEDFDGPYVLKALSIQHRSNADGVALRLADRRALLAAYREMNARLAAPSYSVEAMVDLTHGVELFAGVSRDPRFGPVAMIGIGGGPHQRLHDAAFSLAPVPAGRAERLLRSLRTAALLSGVYGRPAVDVAAAAEMIERITTVAAAHPEIAALEVNPLLVSPHGAIALDARAVPA